MPQTHEGQARLAYEDAARARAAATLDDMLRLLGIAGQTRYPTSVVKRMLRVSPRTMCRMTGAWDAEAGRPREPLAIASEKRGGRRWITYAALVDWLMRNDTYNRCIAP